MKDIVLLGMGGHAYSVVDSIESAGEYHIIGFLENGKKTGEIHEKYAVIGTDDMLEELFEKGIRYAFVAIGFMGEGTIRKRLYSMLRQKGFQSPAIVDRTAVVAKNAKIGEGVYIGKNVVINAGAQIGDMCILNTGSIIEHGSSVGEYTHVAVGSVLCGDVTVGENTFIGANATVIQGIQIGRGVIVGAGTVITRNVEDNMEVYGSITKKVTGN